MKKGLLELLTSKIVQIVNLGDEFPVHEGLQWIDVPDDAETGWDYDAETNSFTDPHAASKDEFGRPREPWLMQRMRAYPGIGDQLDMLHKEIANTGTISSDGAWFKSIVAAKEATPKPINFDPNDPFRFY
jgi:hypothetical protein